MKFLVDQIRQMKEELRELKQKNKELDEHIVSLTHIYDMIAKELKKKGK